MSLTGGRVGISLTQGMVGTESGDEFDWGEDEEELRVGNGTYCEKCRKTN